MEVKWMKVNYGKAYILNIKCSCSYKSVTTDFIVMPNDEDTDDAPTLIKRPTTIPVKPEDIEIVRECSYCSTNVFFREYDVSNHTNQPTLHMCSKLKPIGGRAMVLSFETMDCGSLTRVAKTYGVSSHYVGIITRTVFSRLLPATWKRLCEETEATRPTIKELLQYKQAFIEKIGPLVKSKVKQQKKENQND